MWFSAVQITIVGMGITFFFLIVMVYSINLTGALLGKYLPEKSAEQPAEITEDDTIIAVIAAAIAGTKQ